MSGMLVASSGRNELVAVLQSFNAERGIENELAVAWTCALVKVFYAPQASCWGTEVFYSADRTA
jgi:hypothetical protein